MQGQKTKELVIMGALTAIVFLSQVAWSFLPNVELVTLLFIVYALVFGKKVFFMIYGFVFLEGILYGFGLWWINYLYIWTIQAVITLAFRKERSVIFWAIMSGIYGITFGALCAVPYLFMGGVSSAFAYWVAGVGYDITHCIANAAVCAVLFKPVLYIVERSLQGSYAVARQ